MQKTDWKSDICALRKQEFSMGREFPWFPQDGKFPKLGKFPNLGNFPGIPVREIPGREKFEAIREGGIWFKGCELPLLKSGPVETCQELDQLIHLLHFW